MSTGVKKRLLFTVLVSFCITGFIILATYILTGNMGLGSNSLTIMDGEVQYVDFFNYLRNVLVGNDSIAYTFNKGLGGTGSALFAYYLASPLNIIAALIPEGSMPVITDILFLLKAMLASAFCAFALGKRFPALKSSFTVFIAVGYSLMHWNLTQSSNIMWLDGAYMLPLIMLSVNILIRRGDFVPLSLSLGLSILFNWYTGGFNSIFALFCFIAEMILRGDRKPKSNAGTVLLFIAGMALALMLSMVLFLPNIIALRAGKGSDFDLRGLIGGLTANPLDVIKNSAAGVYNFRGLGSASLFCGSLSLIACVTLFRSSYFSIKEKLVAGALLLIGLASFYLRPFYFIMCLFKSVESYEFRHEYIVIMLVVFLAGWYFSRTFGSREETAGAEDLNKEATRFLQDAVILAAVILALNLIFRNDDRDMAGIIATVIAMPVMGISLYFRRKSTVFAVILCAVVAGELFIQSYATISLYNNDNNIVSEYRAYAEGMEQLKSTLYEDEDMQAKKYRFSETFHRDRDPERLSAYLDDGLAFNIMTNATYSSATENNQVRLMDRLGYKDWAGVLNVVNTSVVPADSLIGVKYVASDVPVAGLEALTQGRPYSGRDLYINPYALPLLYTVKDYGILDTEDSDNTFEYINGLYRSLGGEGTPDVFMEAVPGAGNAGIYMELTGDRKPAGYGQWLSDRIVYIPYDDGNITPEYAEQYDIVCCRLDAAGLKQIMEKLSAENRSEIISIENGHILARAVSDGTMVLQTSVVAADGWTITVNGKKAEPELFADALIRIPLEEGENIIEMSYHVPGVAAGAVLSNAALLILIAAVIIFRLRKHLN